MSYTIIGSSQVISSIVIGLEAFYGRGRVLIYCTQNVYRKDWAYNNAIESFGVTTRVRRWPATWSARVRVPDGESRMKCLYLILRIISVYVKVI